MKAWIYIVSNRKDGVLYVGVTSELKYRIESHKTKKYKDAFSARYNLDKLVYYEEYNSIVTARAREKQLKAGNRVKKVRLIVKNNPEWRDLYDKIIE